MHYSVALVMRFHMSDINICIDASNVLSDMYDFLQWSPELMTYIIATTVAMLQQFTDNDVASGNARCAGMKLVKHFSSQNTRDMILHHPNLMNIVSEAMTSEASPGNLEMQHNASIILHRLLPIVNSAVIWTTDFMLVDEKLLLAAFALRNSSNVVHPLNALRHLHIMFPDIVQQRERALEICKRTLMGFGADFTIMQAVFALLSEILKGFSMSGDPACTMTTKNTPEASTIIIIITTVMLARITCTESKTLCVSAFGALFLLCQNHSFNLQCVIDNDV